MEHKIKQLRTAYRKRTLREQLLVSGMGGVLVILGFLWMWGQWSDLVSKKAKQGEERTYQEMILGKEAEIEGRLAVGLALFDRQKTFERNQFLEKVEALAKTTGVKYKTEGMQERNLEVFEEYSVMLKFESMDIGGLVNYLKSVDAMNPYLGSYKLEVIPERRDPRQLRVSSGLVAIRLKEKAK